MKSHQAANTQGGGGALGVAGLAGDNKAFEPTPHRPEKKNQEKRDPSPSLSAKRSALHHHCYKASTYMYANAVPAANSPHP